MIEKEYATQLKARYEALKALRTPFEYPWQQSAEYFMPRRDPKMTAGTVPNANTAAVLFDTTGVQANQTLSSGQLAWMSPMESTWYAYTAPITMKASPDALVRWLSKATEISREVLANSNFYNVVHEFYMDRSCFGTACMFVDEDPDSIVTFEHWPVGSYVIGQNSKGIVDTVVREKKYTIRNLVQEYGEANVSEDSRKKYQENKMDEEVTVLHFIMPREDARRSKVPWKDEQGVEHQMYSGAENMPVASIHLELNGCTCVRNSGYPEMPCLVSRFLTWGSGFGSLWGYSPSFVALPDALQLNDIQMNLDALAEKAAFPPMISPAGMYIDSNAHGISYFDENTNPSLLPRELVPAGRYDIGKDRVEEKKASINAAFHVDVFQMFSQLDRPQMTAREVAERSSEKLIQHSPTYARLTTELFNPLHARVFNVLLRAWRLGGPEEIPAEAIKGWNGPNAVIPPPPVQYSSRMALAMRALPELALHRQLELLGIMFQMNPSVPDNLDMDGAWRSVAISSGLPADFLRPIEDRTAIRTARQQAEQQAQQAEQAAAMAQAAGNLGKIPADSPIAGAMKSAAA